MRLVLFACIAIITISPLSIYSQGSVSIDHVDGLFEPGKLSIGTVKFHIRFTNNTGQAITGYSNGFRVYSPDGASWSPLICDPNGSLPIFFDGGTFVNYFSNDGTGADTVGFSGFSIFGDGLPDGFDDIVITIQTTISQNSEGLSICIDSSFFYPGGMWLWSHKQGTSVSPSWDGPHCFEIVVPPCCCVGLRGDINDDGDNLNISDITFLVDYLFGGRDFIPCMDEADVNADYEVGISDLTCLVDYMFSNAPECVQDCYVKNRWCQ